MTGPSATGTETSARDRSPAGGATTAAWDAFVDSVAGGGLRQSSRWAELKAFQGWRTHRSVLRRGGAIVAGAQVLWKPAPVAPSLGTVAYCARGPLVGVDDPFLVDQVLDELRRFCRRRRVQALIVQPARGGPALEDRLLGLGCIPSPVPVAPEATVVVDLTREFDVLERDLGKALRKKLRRAVRKGVRVRLGGRADLDTFHRLLTAASARIGYAILPRGYYERLWDVFGTVGDAALFIAEVDGDAVSAHVCVVAGDTIFSVALGWSGEHGDLGVNDLLDWHTILYGRERGLRSYDLENVAYDTASRLAGGARPSELQLRGSDRYKLKWSRDVVLFPRPHLYVRNPAVRAVLRRVPPRRMDTLGKELAARFRPMEGT